MILGAHTNQKPEPGGESTRPRVDDKVFGVVTLQHRENVVVLVHLRLVRARLVRVVPHAALERRFADQEVGLLRVLRRAQSLLLLGLGLGHLERRRSLDERHEATRLRRERQREGQVEQRRRSLQVRRPDVGLVTPSVKRNTSATARKRGQGANISDALSRAPSRPNEFAEGKFPELAFLTPLDRRLEVFGDPLRLVERITGRNHRFGRAHAGPATDLPLGLGVSQGAVPEREGAEAGLPALVDHVEAMLGQDRARVAVEENGGESGRSERRRIPLGDNRRAGLSELLDLRADDVSDAKDDKILRAGRACVRAGCERVI